MHSKTDRPKGPHSTRSQIPHATLKPLTEPSRGADFCPDCGAQVKWIRLLTGRWIAVEPEPVLYVDGGRAWLVDDRKYDADIKKRCKVWRPGIVSQGIRKGYKPHAWECGR